MQVLRKNFRDLVFVCTFGEDDTSEKKVVYSDTDEDRMLLMVREFIYLFGMVHVSLNFLSTLNILQKLGHSLNDAIQLLELALLLSFIFKLKRLNL
jgi:hypothetical protein